MLEGATEAGGEDDEEAALERELDAALGTTHLASLHQVRGLAHRLLRKWPPLLNAKQVEFGSTGGAGGC